MNPRDPQQIRSLLGAWLLLPGTHRRVVALGTRGWLLSRTDPRRRHMLDHFDVVYPVDLGATLALRRRGWQAWGCDTWRLLAEVVGDTSSVLDRQIRVFYFGGLPGVGSQVMERLTQSIPPLVGVGVRPVQDELWGPENHHALRQINAVHPDIVLVGLPSPLREEWIHAHGSLLDTALVWGIEP